VTDRQLDLFSDTNPETVPSPAAAPAEAAERAVVAADLDDDALIASISEAGLADSAALAGEAGRRRLVGAIPALTALCRRLAGFGAGRIVPEQSAALDALAEIGGPDAAQAVSRLISHSVVQGPTLTAAVAVAVRMSAPLPADILGALLRHADPLVRASACRCARRAPETMTLLVGLLHDGDRTVATAAACALGRLGRSEARPALKRLLRERPSREAIEAVSSIADDECMVLLGRIARGTPALADRAIEALEAIDHPRASTVAAAARRLAP
jgi:hypothetical protein